LSDPSEIVIRPATAADIDDVLELLTPFVDQQLLLPRERAEIKALLASAFCAVEGTRIVGFAAVEIYSRKLAELQCLAVHENYQRHGIGKQLVSHCIKLSRDRQILELMAISASDQFLKECGFDYSLPNQKRALFYWPVD
jgi:amino-acid N-acetyltransferase